VFTGLIAALGDVSAIERDGNGARLQIRSDLARELQAGDSIAVSGVCLTATEVTADGFAADAMTETLRHTTLAELQAGSAVNLELALRAGERLGGHVVLGHVDGTGLVTAVVEEGFSRRLSLETDPELLPYLALKGSVAIDGVSLTVSDLGARGLSVSLIPETLQRTTLGGVRVGDRVNLEVDILAKQVERLLGAPK
jgi:riboflavin synthase